MQVRQASLYSASAEDKATGLAAPKMNPAAIASQFEATQNLGPPVVTQDNGIPMNQPGNNQGGTPSNLPRGQNGIAQNHLTNNPIQNPPFMARRRGVAPVLPVAMRAPLTQVLPNIDLNSFQFPPAQVFSTVGQGRNVFRFQHVRQLLPC